MIAFGLLAACLTADSAAAQSTERVSLNSAGAQGGAGSSVPSISRDGRYVAFQSYASNLAPGDTNGCLDVFVHDRLTGITSRVSVNSLGGQGNGDSFNPAIAADGSCVAFHSLAANLVPGDGNGRADVFVHDLSTAQTTRVSLNSNGIEGNEASTRACISADGLIVGFLSLADNLVPGDTNSCADVFAHDRSSGITKRHSVSSAGSQGTEFSTPPSISGDGRVLVFASLAHNLVPNDNNRGQDVFAHDRQTGTTTRVSVTASGAEGNFPSGSWGQSLSADGRYVAFVSSATNFVANDTNQHDDVFLHDRQTGGISRISVSSTGAEGNDASRWPDLSDDGMLVAFTSVSDDLVSQESNGVDDVFVHDRGTGQTRRVSKDDADVQGNGVSLALPAISADGQVVAFASQADNLVPGDTNGVADVFVHDRLGSTLTLTVLGSCPGALRVTVRNATPHGRIVIACGPAGAFVRTTPPCAGLQLSVTAPAHVRIARALAGGSAEANLQAGPGLCGLSVQAVDLTTCAPTNVIVL